MQENNVKNWFVVMSKPNQELKAIKNLRNQNFDIFCPYFEKEIGVRFNTVILKSFFISFLYFCKIQFK